MKVLTVAGLVLALFGLASQAAPVSQEVPAVVISEQTAREALVTAVDIERREVALTLPSGATELVTVSPEVRNLEQLKAGDKVLTTVRQSFVMRLKPGGGYRMTSEGGGVSQSEAGQAPAIAAVDKVDFIADVKSVDKASGRVIALGAKGKEVTLNITNQDVLDVMRPGDQLVGRYSKSLAISVTPSP
ncbi:hypothetical protein [uncultured Aquitalea sp.]|uniref:hypothetical protein n=1 Tax=uncultured Aquitalea sp. TaxID=540272 RepID=UPI0025E44EC7|nr:hypothetical protein [uncultured Aquitalea sp.]